MVAKYSYGGMAVWLGGCASVVYGIIALGGYTRLSRSGLSMTSWRPQGSLPPRTQEEWEVEFERYKQYPEYQRANSHFELSDFQRIFWPEYLHRMAGRFLGVAFALPAAVFLARGKVPPFMKKHLGVLFGMGAAQGGVGWWMVKSGLDGEKHSHNDLPRVSPYRLAAHLASAFAIYTYMLSLSMRLWHMRKPDAANVAKVPKRFKAMAHVATALVGLTAFSGAFVAGNDAGRVYDEWPTMGGRMVPGDLVNEYIQPVWKNAFENSVMVQFFHRHLGESTALACFATALMAQRVPSLKVQRAGKLLGAMGLVQMSLGIGTLLHGVPTSLACTHQAGAVALLSAGVYTMHAARRPGPALKAVQALRTATPKVPPPMRPGMTVTQQAAELGIKPL
ncbi:MAG: hypothetical protein MHM6MM_003292 [Cercozoa sp. M6MM]